MDKNRIILLQGRFDDIVHMTDSEPPVEYWTARELQTLLGYERWENFEESIHRAMVSFNNSNASKADVADHFREVTKKVALGSGAYRDVRDYMLTRLACYLIAQNGDPRKEEIAFAQSYFALQTRRQELLQDRLQLIARMEARGRLREAEKQLSQNIYERGVDDEGFGRIRSAGDAALFGGKRTAQMKSIMGVPDGRPLADFLPTLTIAAKNLATEMTNHNVQERDMHGEMCISTEHVQNNASVREMLGQRGIRPEHLPPAEDIKKLERRVKREEKRLTDNASKLPKGD